jgi:hypothetical protein
MGELSPEVAIPTPHAHALSIIILNCLKLKYLKGKGRTLWRKLYFTIIFA